LVDQAVGLGHRSAAYRRRSDECESLRQRKSDQGDWHLASIRKEVSQTKTVIAKSGSAESLVFDPSSSDDPVETTLTLNVPEGASVVLANNSTKSDGNLRVYRTKQLKVGEAWDDYKIQVTLNGVTKEKTIRLIGGDKLEMSFNFADIQANKLASID
jgi:uncharacterized protein (TIGR03000 family)